CNMNFKIIVILLFFCTFYFNYGKFALMQISLIKKEPWKFFPWQPEESKITSNSSITWLFFHTVSTFVYTFLLSIKILSETKDKSFDHFLQVFKYIFCFLIIFNSTNLGNLPSI